MERDYRTSSNDSWSQRLNSSPFATGGYGAYAPQNAYASDAVVVWSVQTSGESGWLYWQAAPGPCDGAALYAWR